jgi:hypothetical protein
MRRREFISLLGSAAALWPIRARAQMPVVGFVNSSSAQAQTVVVAAYRRGLEESGFIEGCRPDATRGRPERRAEFDALGSASIH